MPATYTNLVYHIVFSTKQRAPLIRSDVRDELYHYIGGIIRNEGGVALQLGGVADHIHVLARFRPATAVAEMLNRIKANSSKWMNAEKMDLRKFGWQEGYAAFSVSESRVQHVADYIRNQEERHRTWSFQDELRALLERHAVDYDERYLFD